MKGKATLILTDKDTGKTVKKLEEHNMVTNALSKLVQLPHMASINMPNINFYTKLFPIWNNLLTGVVMFENSLEENAYKFMIPPTVKPVGSAGREYTGTNPKRGTLNLSQSGPIENGYRFVWDFAPEKAVGTIRSIGLTNPMFANIGFSDEHSTGMGMTALPQYMDTASNSSSIPIASIPWTFFGKIKNNDYYSFRMLAGAVTLYINRSPDISALKILDTTDAFLTPVTISEIPVSLPFTVTNLLYHFYNPSDDILYFFNSTTDSLRTVNIFEYAGVDPDTGAVVKHGSVQMPYVRVYTTLAFAHFNNRFYVCITSSADNALFVFNSAGQLVENRSLNAGHTFDFFVSNGYLMCTESLTGYYGKFFVDHPEYFTCYSDNQRHANSENIALPYSVRYTPDQNKTNLLLTLRTDYLATVNNLSEPLEKTDRHALQIRYELTN